MDRGPGADRCIGDIDTDVPLTAQWPATALRRRPEEPTGPEPSGRIHAIRRKTERCKVLAGRHKERERKGGKKVLDSGLPGFIVSFPSFNAPRQTNGAKEETSARLTVPSEHFSLFGGEKY
jgi:hypothetical protein